MKQNFSFVPSGPLSFLVVVILSYEAASFKLHSSTTGSDVLKLLLKHKSVSEEKAVSVLLHLSRSDRIQSELCLEEDGHTQSILTLLQQASGVPVEELLEQAHSYSGVSIDADVCGKNQTRQNAVYEDTGIMGLLPEPYRFRAWQEPHTTINKEALNNCSVYVLDVTKDLPHLALPSCDVERDIRSVGGVVVGAYDKKDLGQADTRFHWSSQYAQTFWIAKQWRDEGTAASMDEADVILVDDYCYQAAQVAQWHSGHYTKVWGEGPMVTHLDDIYQAVSELPRFRRNHGIDFAVSYLHPGNGGSPDVRCKVLSNVLHVNDEKSQNYRCEREGAKRSQLLGPYSSTEMLTGIDDKHEPKDYMAFMVGSCADWQSDNATTGKGVRLALSKELGPKFEELGLPASIQCLGTSLPTEVDKEGFAVRGTHQAMRSVMQRSRFCLTPPGDAASSRRITEYMLAGCIPVFIAPAWHAMPMAEYVPYKDFSVFIYVRAMERYYPPSHFSEWRDDMNEPYYDTLDDWKAPYIPDADIKDAFVTVDNATDIATVLLGMSKEEVERKASAVDANAHFFMHNRHPHASTGTVDFPNVPDVVKHNLCRRAGKL